MSGVRNADCTLFHREWDELARQDVWHCTQFSGVSWYAGKGISVGTAGETAADAAAIRIYTQEPLAVDVGDVLVPGLVTAQAESSADVLRRFPGSVKVLRVRDNRRGGPRMQHYLIEGA